MAVDELLHCILNDGINNDTNLSIVYEGDGSNNGDGSGSVAVAVVGMADAVESSPLGTSIPVK